MQEERIAQLEQQVDDLKRNISMLFFSDRYIFSRDLELQGARNIQLSTLVGTKIGTGTNQLLGFYNVTPVDQPATVADAATQGGTYNQTDINTIVTAVNTVIDRLQELGLIA